MSKKAMSIHEIVVKLIGPTCPIGETNEDNARYENLKVMTHLVGKLLFDIDMVSKYKSCPEFSKSRAGKMAQGFLKDVKEVDE